MASVKDFSPEARLSRAWFRLTTHGIQKPSKAFCESDFEELVRIGLAKHDPYGTGGYLWAMPAPYHPIERRKSIAKRLKEHGGFRSNDQ